MYSKCLLNFSKNSHPPVYFDPPRLLKFSEISQPPVYLDPPPPPFNWHLRVLSPVSSLEGSPISPSSCRLSNRLDSNNMLVSRHMLLVTPLTLFLLGYEQSYFFLFPISRRGKIIGFRAPAFAMFFPRLDELKRKHGFNYINSVQCKEFV